MKHYRDNTVKVKMDENGWVESRRTSPGAPIPIGIFADRESPEYCDSYAAYVQKRALPPTEEEAGRTDGGDS
jgi:hypothetical protein